MLRISSTAPRGNHLPLPTGVVVFGLDSPKGGVCGHRVHMLLTLKLLLTLKWWEMVRYVDADDANSA